MRGTGIIFTLSAFLVLAIGGDASAQRYYGGYGGHHGYRGYYPAYGYGSYTPYAYYGYQPRPYYYGGYAASPYNFFNSTAYYYGVPNTVYVPQATVPAVAQAGYNAPDAGTATATIRVLLPAADARVWVSGKWMESQGAERTFHTPALERGKRYTYTIKAEWAADGKTVSQTREAEFLPGGSIDVNFREPLLPNPMTSR